MQKNQRVADMAGEVLARQAGIRTERTGETSEAALIAVLKTEAGRQLGRLGDGPHCGELAQRWQEDLPRERAEERSRVSREELAWKREQERKQERALVLRDAAWERFMRAALRGLASEDRRQAEEGLVALMSGGKVSYKHVEELCQEDMPARVAANRLRTTWLKERRDGWLDRGEILP